MYIYIYVYLYIRTFRINEYIHKCAVFTCREVDLVNRSGHDLCS